MKATYQQDHAEDMLIGKTRGQEYGDQSSMPVNWRTLNFTARLEGGKDIISIPEKADATYLRGTQSGEEYSAKSGLRRDLMLLIGLIEAHEESIRPSG